MPSTVASGTIIPLGECENFAVMAGTAASFNGEQTVLYSGSVGVSPGTAITGNYGLVTGSVANNNNDAINCIANLGTAYLAASGATCNTVQPSENLGGLTLYPGVYCSGSGAFIITSSTILTLDGQADKSAQWIFQSATTVITSTASQVVLSNGADAKNVFWAIGSSATIGYNSKFAGTILAKVSISVESSAVIVGRTLALAAVSYAGKSMVTMPDEIAEFQV
jgi:hypothetical protein